MVSMDFGSGGAIRVKHPAAQQDEADRGRGEVGTDEHGELNCAMGMADHQVKYGQ